MTLAVGTVLFGTVLLLVVKDNITAALLRRCFLGDVSICVSEAGSAF